MSDEYAQLMARATTLEMKCVRLEQRIAELEEQLNASRRIAKAHANNFAKAEARLDAVRMLPEINMGFFIDGKPAPVVWVHDVKAALGGDDE